MLVLSHDDVIAALPPAECAAAMAEVLAARARGETHMPLRSIMAPPEADGLMGLMPAWRAARDGRPAVFSLKAICLMPGNPTRGLDAHQGVVMLFDGETGVPHAVLDASAITEVRTAAVTSVATDALARDDAKVLAILGAGVQARSHLVALLEARPFEAVRIYAPTAAHARSVATAATDGTRAEIAVAPSAEEAIRGADVVVTATNSREPVLRLGWLEPGTHLNAIGASTPSARELDADTVAACALIPDSRDSLEAEAGEYQLAVRDGLIDPRTHVRAELGEVLDGTRPGRLDNREITLFRSLGIAVEDLAAAQHAVAGARRLGLGVEI